MELPGHLLFQGGLGRSLLPSHVFADSASSPESRERTFSRGFEFILPDYLVPVTQSDTGLRPLLIWGWWWRGLNKHGVWGDTSCTSVETLREGRT